MQVKKFFFRVLLVILILSPNLFLLISNFWLDIDRPLFVYEYLFVFILMSISINHFIVWVVFIFIFLLDLSIVFSKLYFFNLPEFLNALTFFENYSISISQILIFFVIFSVLFSFFLLLKLIKKPQVFT